MKKLLIRNNRDYRRVIAFIRENQIKVSDSGRGELLLFPERSDYSMVVAYDGTRRFFAGEYDLKYEITEWADSVEDLLALSSNPIS